MSDKGDKGNPLDRLTRPGGRPISDDESIPILTERLTLPSLDLDISLPKTPVAAPEPAPPPPASSPPPVPPAAATPPPPDRPAPRVEARAAESSAASRPQAAPPPIPTYSSTATSPAEATAIAPLDWTALEQKLREAVFRELQPALADEAGRLLRERLQPAFERAVLATTAELRQAFDARLREAIARAIAAEIAQHRPRR